VYFNWLGVKTFGRVTTGGRAAQEQYWPWVRRSPSGRIAMRFGFQLLGPVFVLATLAATSAAGQSPEPPARPVPQRIAENLYLLTGAGANVTALVSDNGIVVVDSGNTPRDGEEIVRSLRRLSSAPVRYLVYTHYHNDHVGGGAGFPPTTVVVSNANTRPMVSAEARIMGPTLADTLLPWNIEALYRELAAGDGTPR
jgi:glyoxylase-like metal-dependent hydrolase (beta-lactamase superfamily II)